MFKSKEIKMQLRELNNKKEELKLFNAMLEEQSPKINIKNLFVLAYNDKYSIVEKVKSHFSRTNNSNLTETKIHLIDIFTGETLYSKDDIYKIQCVEIENQNTKEITTVYVFPILDIDFSLSSFSNKQVPLYKLLRLYHELNNSTVSKNKQYIK